MMVLLTSVWFYDRVFDKRDLGRNKTIKFTNKVLNNRISVSLRLISPLILMKSNKKRCQSNLNTNMSEKSEIDSLACCMHTEAKTVFSGSYKTLV